jgi:hypothetical protein
MPARTRWLITSNLPFSKWDSIFKDPMTTAAAIDRLVHHSTIVELNLPSYRLQAAKRGSGRGAAPSSPERAPEGKVGEKEASGWKNMSRGLP